MKRLLIVVDYQVDFVNGSLGFDGAELLDQKIAEKIQQYHMAGDDVVFTLDTHETDYLSTEEGKNLPAEPCIHGRKGWELFGETKALHRCGTGWAGFKYLCSVQCGDGKSGAAKRAHCC